MTYINTLPQLDGTIEAVKARLDAWVRGAAAHTLDQSLYKVRCGIGEALSATSGLSSAEECNGECCTKAGDVEYLVSELQGARDELLDLAESLGTA